MGVRDWFRSEKPVTAAAVKVHEPGTLSNMAIQSREAGEAWTAYRTLGEVGYVTNQQARLIGRLDWIVTVGGGEPLDNDQSDELMRAAFGDNVEDLATQAALMLQVPGGYMLCRTIPGDPDSWRVFSMPLSAKNKKAAEKSDVVVSVRTEDPEDNARNDSPVLRAMGTCRELMLVRAQARAQARNRTAQHGILLYPLEGISAGQTPAAFEAALQDVMVAPLSDERTTASVTPNLVGFSADLIEKWNLLDISGDYDEKLDAKDERLVRSLAVQLDNPPEILLGFSDSNHWSTWAIQEDNWNAHSAPVAKPIGRGFAEAIMQAVSATEIKVEPDPGPLMVRRPTTSDALAANDAGLVSDEWTREQLGATEADAPEIQQEDPAVAKALEMVIAAPSLAQDPGLGVLVADIRAVLSGGTPPPRRVESTQVDAPAVAEPRAIAAALADVFPPKLEAVPEPVVAATSGPDPRALSAIDTQAYDAVEDLVNDTTDRVLERLGAKVRSMAQRTPIEIPADVSNVDAAVAYDGDIPNADVMIADTIAATFGKVDRIIERAFARVRSEGVEVSADPDDLSNARDLYAALVAEAVATRLEDKPAVALAWQASRRVVAVAGGNGDTAPVVASFPVAAAAGLPVAGQGIALGRRSFTVIQDVYQLVPGSYTWLHEYRGKHPLPEHERLAGRSFNGEYILEDGRNWYPGDHAGCQCAAVPEFRSAG